MALLYLYLEGIVQNWFERLPLNFKQDWPSFIQLFKKQFCSQKLAHQAQLKAHSLVKKDNEALRNFAVLVET